MPYTPTNNPYAVGDPYMYDSKWIVQEIKKIRKPEEEAAKAEAAANEAKNSAANALTSERNAAISASNAVISENSARAYAENIADPVSGIVTDWLADNITTSPTVVIDTSLSIQGAAADAKATGDAISDANTNINLLKTSLNRVYSEDFAAFPTHSGAASTTTFTGFATPYNFNNIEVAAIDIYGGFWGAANTQITYTLNLMESNFVNIVASASVTKTRELGTVRFVFNTPITLNGVYYIQVLAGSNGYFQTPNRVSAISMRSSTYPNRYRSGGTWYLNTTGYDVDATVYHISGYSSARPPFIKYIGADDYCDFATVDDAMRSIVDDSATNQYTLYVLAGTYSPFSTYYSDGGRISPYGRVRYFNIIGFDPINTVFTDPRGNYDLTPCEFYLNGIVKNISFKAETNAGSYSPASGSGKQKAYAAHIDFGACNLTFENCYFYSNAGPAVGAGTYKDAHLIFNNCVFVSDNDLSFASDDLGAIYVHPRISTNPADKTNQSLTINNCRAVAEFSQYGGIVCTIPTNGDGGTYKYQFSNNGSFNTTAKATISSALKTNTCYNNTPATINS